MLRLSVISLGLTLNLDFDYSHRSPKATLDDRDPRIIDLAMCRVGTVVMTSPGCNHARQNGWQDSQVGMHLSSLLTRCSECKSGKAFCGKLSIDKSLDSQSGSSTGRFSRGAQPLSLASLVQPTPDAGHSASTLDGKCKFCTLYESEIRLADQIKRTLVDYNMALLPDEARVMIEAQSKGTLILFFLTPIFPCRTPTTPVRIIIHQLARALQGTIENGGF